MNSSEFTPSDVKRFWSKCSITDLFSCWNWQRCLSDNGYGKFGIPSRPGMFVHRVADCLEPGTVPPGMEVYNSCDNRKCCNPAHLFLGTHAENMKDLYEKRRYTHGATHPNARLSAADVQYIRSLPPRTSRVELAKQFGVSHSVICEVISGKA